MAFPNDSNKAAGKFPNVQCSPVPTLALTSTVAASSDSNKEASLSTQISSHLASSFKKHGLDGAEPLTHNAPYNAKPASIDGGEPSSLKLPDPMYATVPAHAMNGGNATNGERPPLDKYQRVAAKDSQSTASAQKAVLADGTIRIRDFAYERK